MEISIIPDNTDNLIIADDLYKDRDIRPNEIILSIPDGYEIVVTEEGSAYKIATITIVPVQDTNT